MPSLIGSGRPTRALPTHNHRSAYIDCSISPSPFIRRPWQNQSATGRAFIESDVETAPANCESWHKPSRGNALQASTIPGQDLSVSNSEGRVLKFFVSGALLTGATACAKETEADHPEAPRASETTQGVEQEPLAAAPNTPVAPSLARDAGDPGERPVPLKRVNTNHQHLPPQARPIAPAVATEPKRVNPRYQDEPQPPTPAQPTAVAPEPDRVNTNHQQEITERPRPPAKLKE